MIRCYTSLSFNRNLVIHCLSTGIIKVRSMMYFKRICLDRISQKNHFILLSGLCFLALICFGFFCYDSDPFDNNDLPDFAYHYPSMSSQNIDQVTFIDILNQSKEFSLIFSNSLLPRSPPV